MIFTLINQEKHPMQDMELAYEAPAVDAVLSAEDVEREVHYAGIITILPQ